MAVHLLAILRIPMPSTLPAVAVLELVGEPIHKIVNKDTRNGEIDYTSATIYIQYRVIWCEKLQKGFGVWTSIT